MFSYCLMTKRTSGKLHLSCSFTMQQGDCQVEFHNSLNGLKLKTFGGVIFHHSSSIGQQLNQEFTQRRKEENAFSLLPRILSKLTCIRLLNTSEVTKFSREYGLSLLLFNSLSLLYLILFHVLCLISLETFQALLLVLKSP